MQVKLIENASSRFSEIEELHKAWEMKDLETFEFLKDNEWKEVYYHHRIRPNWLCEVSEYEKTRKYEIPLELVILEDKKEIVLNLYKKYEKFINFWVIIAIIIVLMTSYNLREKPNLEKTAIQINAENQKKNIDLKVEKLEQQKIIKQQIKYLNNKLDKNIKEVQQLDISNSLLRENSILITNE